MQSNTSNIILHFPLRPRRATRTARHSYPHFPGDTSEGQEGQRGHGRAGGKPRAVWPSVSLLPLTAQMLFSKWPGLSPALSSSTSRKRPICGRKEGHQHRGAQTQEVRTKQENSSFPRALLADSHLHLAGQRQVTWSHDQPSCKGVWEVGVFSAPSTPGLLSKGGREMDVAGQLCWACLILDDGHERDHYADYHYYYGHSLPVLGTPPMPKPGRYFPHPSPHTHTNTHTQSLQKGLPSPRASHSRHRSLWHPARLRTTEEPRAPGRAQRRFSALPLPQPQPQPQQEPLF